MRFARNLQCFAFVLLMLFTFGPSIQAQSLEQLWQELNSQQQLALDVGKLEIRPKQRIQKLKNGVVIIGRETLLKAQRIELDFKNESILAQGDVHLLTENQYLTAEQIEFNNKTGDIFASQSQVQFNLGTKKKKVLQEALGFKWRELDFKRQQAKAFQDIQTQKLKVLLEKSEHYARTSSLPPELVWKYQRLLEKEDLVRLQSPPLTAHLSNKRQKSLAKRSLVAERSKWIKPVSSLDKLSYFKLTGSNILSNKDGTYTATDGDFSPCNCDKDKTLPWSIGASKIEAKKEGYISLRNVFFKVKDVPILYLPFFKLPIKSVRQSGFLLPSFSWSRNTGTIVDLPLYIAPTKKFDLTLTPKYFEDRGIQLGTEFRYASSNRTGWELDLSFIKDQTWLEELRNRSLAKKIYTDGLQNAISGSTTTTGSAQVAKNSANIGLPSYWSGIGRPECTNGNAAQMQNCMKELSFRLSDSPSTWRSSVDWHGNETLGGGFVYKSKGVWRSDRRLEEDTYSNRNYAQSLVARSYARTYQDIQNTLSFAKKGFYGQFSSNLGDYVNTSKHNAGLQAPLSLWADTGWHPVLTRSKLAVYTNLTADSVLVKGLDLSSFDDSHTLEKHSSAWSSFVTLENKAIIPNKWGLKIELHNGADVRYVNNNELAADTDNSTHSSIFSPKYGVSLEIPLVKTIRSRGPASLNPSQMVHFANFKVGFRSRPRVWRKGPYSSEKIFLDPTGQGLSYSLTDRGVIGERADDPLADYDILRRQSRIFFNIAQVLKLKRFKYRYTHDKTRKRDRKSETDKEKALRHLYNVNDNLIKKAKQRNRLSTPAGDFTAEKTEDKNFLELDVGTEYDFYEARLRKENRNLWLDVPVQSPWQDLEMRFKLDAGIIKGKSSFKYDFFGDRLRQHNHSLGLYLPRNTSVLASYEFYRDRSIALNRQSSVPSDIKQWSIAFATDWVPLFQFKSHYSKRLVEQKELTAGLSQPNLDDTYESQFSLAYFPSSNCWGLRAVRTKPFDREEENADYHLEFILKFGPYSRSLPDMSGAVEKWIPGGIQEL